MCLIRNHNFQTTYRRVTIRSTLPLVGCEVVFDQVTKGSVQVKTCQNQTNPSVSNSQKQSMHYDQ